MKKRRPCICVVAVGVDKEYQSEVLEGISTQAYALDYNVAVFSMLDEYSDLSDYYIGERNIFSLINEDKFDGFIFPIEMFNSPETKEYLFDLLLKVKKPVVAVDYANDVFPCVLKNERGLFKEMVDHLIDQHGCKEIMCLTGPKDTFQAEERLAAYKETMQEHGLEVRPEYCIYGDYWSDAAYKLAQDIHEGRIKKPDALACANDRMAMFFIERFTDLGHSVPDEIAVTGYDGITESRDYSPTICTCKVSDAQSGADAVAKLYELISGEKCEPTKLSGGYLIRGESCGCAEEGSIKMRKMHKKIQKEQRTREWFRTANLFERLANTSTHNEFVREVYNYMYVFCDAQQIGYDLCLCKNWDALSSEQNFIKDGYTERMRVINTLEGPQSEFDVSQMYPDLWIEEEKPATFCFFPVHFNARCLGYSVVWYTDTVCVCGKTYWDWHKAVSNGLEFRRAKICLESLNHITYINSIKDKLTGIYNRSGYDKYCEEFLQKAKENNKKFMLISCDMDGLKYTNDNFGHMEGDVSLRVIANGLSYVCLNNEICARVGGDEFIVIGWGDYTEQKIKDLIYQFEQYVDRYNQSSDKGYKVGASTGFAFCDVDDDTDIEKLSEQADKNMYANKFAKPHSHRREEQNN